MPQSKQAQSKNMKDHTLHVYFANAEILRRLKRYVIVEFNRPSGTSMICEKAVDEYLKRQGA